VRLGYLFGKKILFVEKTNDKKKEEVKPKISGEKNVSKTKCAPLERFGEKCAPLRFFSKNIYKKLKKSARKRRLQFIDLLCI